MKVNEIWCSICCRYMDEGCTKCSHFCEQVHLPDVKMTNFDKLLEDPENRKMIMEMAIVYIPKNFCIDVNNMKINHSIECMECKFCKKGIDCDDAMIDWLSEEYVERR